jgi:hypothetical protein
MEQAIARFDAGGAGNFQRSNLLAVSAVFRTIANDPADRDDADASLRLARTLGNPSQLVIALGALGNALVEKDPSAALAALEESASLTKAGASDTMLENTLACIAIVRGALGDETGCIRGFAEAFDYCVDVGDRPSLFGTWMMAVAPLVRLGRVELAVCCAAGKMGAGGGVQFLSANALDQYETALRDAREQLGTARYDALWAEFEALGYDEVVDELRVRFANALAEPPESGMLPPS